MKKVLFVATVVKTHINTFHLPYLQWFADRGYFTAVAAKNDYFPEECHIPHCERFFDLPFRRFPFHPQNIRTYFRLKRIINEHGFDLVHCHTPVGGVLARLAARGARKKFGTKVVYTAHGFHFFKGGPLLAKILYYPVEKLCAHFTDLLITINAEDYSLAQKKFSAGKVVYIPGVGVDTARFARDEDARREIREELNIPATARVYISVGELNDNKNHIAALRALHESADKTCHYIIAGTGKNREMLLDFAEKHLPGRVHLIGYRRDIPRLLSASDVFLFPSHREGLPLSVMEAMAASLPVVCPPIRGCRDLIDDMRGGRLADCDDPAAFAAAMEGISAEHAAAMGRYNREKIRDFDLDAVVSAVGGLYTELGVE